MLLKDLGFNAIPEKYRTEIKPGDFEVGRVIAEHKERYTVATEKGEFEAEITGNLRYSASSREDFPAVGDWVELTIYDPDFSIIHRILPRYSIISRQATGKTSEIQIIATNMDYAFIAQAADRDFNLNRLERYLTICYTGRVTPIILITKTDLVDEKQLRQMLESIRQRIANVPVLTVSNTTHDGYDELKRNIENGKTYCLLGSSGIGKSTLINNLSGKTLMKTETISDSTGKGRHTTSHRELVVLPGGGILIDNPGMREVGIADSESGLHTAFDKIMKYAMNCKYDDCTHTSEAGCAVRAAAESGEIDLDAYENYLKMEREKEFFESSVAERRKKDKSFGKMLKNYKKDVNKNRH